MFNEFHTIDRYNTGKNIMNSIANSHLFLLTFQRKLFSGMKFFISKSHCMRVETINDNSILMLDLIECSAHENGNFARIYNISSSTIDVIGWEVI